MMKGKGGEHLPYGSQNLAFGRENNDVARRGANEELYCRQRSHFGMHEWRARADSQGREHITEAGQGCTFVVEGDQVIRRKVEVLIELGDGVLVGVNGVLMLV